MPVQVCAVKIGELRKAITQKRKLERITGAKGRTQLMELLTSHRELPGVAAAINRAARGVYAMSEDQASDLDDPSRRQISGRQRLNSLSAAELRRQWKQAAAKYHEPVSKMKAQDVIRYLYATAQHLDWDWSDALQGRDVKKRVSKACKDSAQPGAVANAPASVLPKPRKPKATAKSTKLADRPRADDGDDDDDLVAVDKDYLRSTLPKAGPRAAQGSSNRSTEMEFVQAPQAKAKSSKPTAGKRAVNSGAIAAGSTLSDTQKRFLKEYRASGRDGRSNETFAKRAQWQMQHNGISFKEALALAKSRDAREARPVAKRKTKGQPNIARFIDHGDRDEPLHGVRK